MARLLSVATALGDHAVTAAETIRDFSTALSPNAAARIRGIVLGSGNEARHLTFPLDKLRRLGTLEDRNREYLTQSIRLGEAVSLSALRNAGIDPGAITTIIGISSSGYLMPTLETHLRNRLSLSASCRRVPMTQLGCAGGTAGLNLAAALAASGETVLVVSVELPSLSFPSAEPSLVDLIAATQYGDGAAAAVVTCHSTMPAPAIVGSTSICLSSDVPAHNEILLTTQGLRIRPPDRFGNLIRENLKSQIDHFLENYQLRISDILFWAIHPRNLELLNTAGVTLGIQSSHLVPSRTVWRRCGNLISAAVFHVLREMRDSSPPPVGAPGLVLSYGAGSACELMLVRADGWMCWGATQR